MGCFEVFALAACRSLWVAAFIPLYVVIALVFIAFLTGAMATL